MNAPTNDDIDTLAGEYVLGTLSAGARATVAERMSREPALREAVQAWEARLLPLAAVVAPADPSPGLWERIERSIGPSSAPAARSSALATWWNNLHLWRGPVSLGLVKPGQTLQVPLDKLPPLEANQLFELTLEPANGSPIDRPTGPIQFIGRAVKVL